MRILHDPVLVCRDFAGSRGDRGRNRAHASLCSSRGNAMAHTELRRGTAAAHKLVGHYPAFDLVKVVNGVPVLRMKDAIVEVVRYHRNHLAKSIRIRVLSRFAEPEEMAKLYWDFC